LRITPDGKTVPTTYGLRSPGGIAFNAKGDTFYTDNQGPWNGSCALKELRPGEFVGHPGGFKWYDLEPEMGPKPNEPKSGSRWAEEMKRIPEYRPAVVVFPYDLMGKSAAGVVGDATEGKFGPFAGQVFVTDQSHSVLMRCSLETKYRGRREVCAAQLRYLAIQRPGTTALPLRHGGLAERRRPGRQLAAGGSPGELGVPGERDSGGVQLVEERRVH
jgi:hypothetical protein